MDACAAALIDADKGTTSLDGEVNDFADFLAVDFAEDPPKIVTSWLNTQTGRPWIAPTPVMTPSVYGRLRSMPKFVER